MARARKGRKTAKSVSAGEDQVFYAGLYGRLSVLDNGKDGDPIESQIDILEKYVSERPYLRRVQLYLDNGCTGTNFQRPAWERLLSDVQAGKINCIVVKDLSRLGRNYLEAGSFLEKDCPRLGVRFISINDGYDSAELNSSEELAAALKNIINDHYAKDISRKTCSALASKRLKGDFVGSYAPYGYQKDPQNKNHLIIDPETAPIVRQIYAWRAAGDGYGTILRRLNEQGVPSPGRYRFEHGIITNNNKKGAALLWGRHAVSDILKNTVYIGHLAQGKCRASLYQGIPIHSASQEEWDVAYHTHEPLIDEALFDAAQAVNEKGKTVYWQDYGKYKNLSRESNPYREKLVCADCGTQLKLYRNLYRGGKKSCYTYICPTFETHKELRCNAKKSIRSDKLDGAVLAAVQTQMALFAGTTELLLSLLSRKIGLTNGQNQRTLEAQRLRQELARKTGYASSLYGDWKDGLLSFQEYSFAKEAYRLEINALQQRLQEAESREHQEQERIPQAEAWQEKIAQCRRVQSITPELVRALIQEIRVSGDGSISISFSFEDEYRKMQQDIQHLQNEVAL